MDPDNIRILADNGWTVECESPFEVRHEDGSFATGGAAEILLTCLRYYDEGPLQRLVDELVAEQRKAVKSQGTSVRFLDGLRAAERIARRYLEAVQE